MHSFDAGTEFAQTNIVGDGGIEKEIVLGNNSDLIAKRLQIEFFDIDTVNKNGTGCDIKESRYKIGHSRFTRARKPHQRYHLARFDIEADIA